MTDREIELLEDCKHEDAERAVNAVVALCKEFLFVRKEYERAEFLLLEKVGIQSPRAGYILELNLGETYLEMNELTRAKRFLEIASASRVDVTKDRASELLKALLD
jgi:hypothetical protein